MDSARESRSAIFVGPGYCATAGERGESASITGATSVHEGPTSECLPLSLKGPSEPEPNNTHQ